MIKTTEKYGLARRKRRSPSRLEVQQAREIDGLEWENLALGVYVVYLRAFAFAARVLNYEDLDCEIAGDVARDHFKNAPAHFDGPISTGIAHALLLDGTGSLVNEKPDDFDEVPLEQWVRDFERGLKESDESQSNESSEVIGCLVDTFTGAVRTVTADDLIG